MTAPKWDTLPADWTAVMIKCGDEMIPAEPGQTFRHPLATRSGLHAFHSVLTADAIWRNLTRPQRELLLSTVAGHPIQARADVARRLVRRGLITFLHSGRPGFPLATDAGRFVVQWRLP